MLEQHMDGREEVATLLETARESEGMKSLQAHMLATTRYLAVIDGEIRKLRKELRTRNGGEDVGS